MSQELLTGTGSSTSTAMPEAAAATLPSATFMLADASAPTLADSGAMSAPSTPFSRKLLFIPATPEHSDIRQTPQNLAFEKAVSHGGQATIFKAHTPSGTPVAVKVFENSEECLLEWRSLKKFSNFRVLPNALAHGTVCMPHAVGAQEKSCIVEEWLDGDTLAKHLRRTGRGMTVEETLSTMSPVIAFLATAETELRVGVIHHDVKPSNILLDSTGCVRLIDFGIAQTSRDQARLAWGTQGFSSPESCFPSSGETDLRKGSDAYSLAATMLALLAGENKPPAYGVVAQNSDGSLRYDPAWTDERERFAHERSITPFPAFIEYAREKGIYLEEAALNDFTHDAETLDFLKEDIAETLQSTYGIEESAAAVEKAAHAAVDAFDAKLRATLGACLAVDAARQVAQKWPATTADANAAPPNRDASIAQPQAGADFAIMRAQLGCNPDTAQPQRGRSSAALNRAHNRRSNNFSNESTGSNHGIRHRYALCRQCHRMLPLHHFLHLLRRDAHRCRPGVQVPAHDWRACRASRRKRPRPLDRDQQKRAPALCAATELFNHERTRTAPRFKLRSCRGKPHHIFAAFGLGERFSSLD